MPIDLRTFKIGEKVKTFDGRVGLYIGYGPKGTKYQHAVRFSDGEVKFYSDRGYAYVYETRDDLDQIVTVEKLPDYTDSDRLNWLIASRSVRLFSDLKGSDERQERIRAMIDEEMDQEAE